MTAAKAQTTSIAPLLFVRNGARAVEFYKSAFGAREVSCIADPDGKVVARLSIEGAEFWLADESPEYANVSPETLGGSCVRILIATQDPDTMFAAAIAAGSTEVYPVEDQSYGWRLGRLTDPFGHQWEIGKPLCDGVA